MNKSLRPVRENRLASFGLALACAAGVTVLATPAAADCTSVLLPGAPASGARFGQRVAWDGDLAIVGAPQDRNGGGTVVGAVYLYHRVGSSWTLEARFEGDGLNGVLGDQVAISASGFAAAGRPSVNFLANLGIVRTFVRNAGAGTWSSANSISYAGYPDNPTALAMWGSDLVIGLGTFPFSGFGDFLHERYNPGTGTFTFVTEPGGPNTGPIRAMALEGTVLVLGYPESQSGTPSVSVLNRTTTSSSDWYASGATLFSGDSASASAGFGDAVAYTSLSGERIAVGAPRGDFPSNESGAVYVFKKTGGLWSLEQRVESPLAAALAHFGQSVSIRDTTLLVGQPEAAGGAGRVFVFDHFAVAPFWRYSNALVGDGLASSSASFGSAVALQGARGLVGAPGEASNTGAVLSIDDVHCTMIGFCFGDGSGTACPCGNSSPSERDAAA